MFKTQSISLMGSQQEETVVIHQQAKTRQEIIDFFKVSRTLTGLRIVEVWGINKNVEDVMLLQLLIIWRHCTPFSTLEVSIWSFQSSKWLIVQFLNMMDATADCLNGAIAIWRQQESPLDSHTHSTQAKAEFFQGNAKRLMITSSRFLLIVW